MSMEMEDQYGLPDLRHLMSGRHDFQAAISPPSDLYSGHRNLQQAAPPPPQPYEMLMMGPPGSHHQAGNIMMHHHHRHRDHDQLQSSDYSAHAAAVTATPGAGAFCGRLEAVDMVCLGGDGGTGRWPRQETLTLLEVRSRLDPRFKEANQKGPLWDEVSRIMCEEHGYQRSGKKCREKFENLYKYYKKTKEGKAGRQDGKHYRFFRQLEALYGGGGETTYDAYNNNSHRLIAAPSQAPPEPQKLSHSLSLSNNSSELDTSSSHCGDDDDSAAAGKGKKKAGGGGKRSWKAKIREFVDSQMRRLVEKQDTWLETMQRSLEQKERERTIRDDAWREQEASRMDRQQRFWASERAWIEARDAALVEALHALTSQTKSPPVSDNNKATNADGWSEYEISRLVQLRAGMEERFGQIGCSEEVLWEEVAAELGYERTAPMCREKWTDIHNNNNSQNTSNASVFLNEGDVMGKNRKENSTRSYCYFPTAPDSVYADVAGAGSAAAVACFVMDERGTKMVAQTSELLNGSSSSSPCEPPPNNGAQVQDGCFRMLMADGGSNMWDDYGLKLN